MSAAEQVLRFWEQAGPEAWYRQDDGFDAEIRARFGALWDEAAEGGLGLWLTDPCCTLGYILLTDQFPRNMFRGDPRSFATDPQARSAAKGAIGRDWDLKVEGPLRQFFYLPLMHSENLVDQDRAVRLFAARMPGSDNLLHARAHRAVIRRFGRFPFRNAALGRETKPDEAAWLEGGAYRSEVERLKEAA